MTMEIIQQIANSINPMIRLTVETPCNFEDGTLPVLDVKVDVNEKEANRKILNSLKIRLILASSAQSF